MPTPSSTRWTSILIDEARTPLIISGPSDDRSDLYASIDKLIPRLAASDYEIDEKQRSASLTEDGNENVEQLLREAGLLTEGSLYESSNVTLVHHVNQALRAHKLFQRDKDYIVRNGEVVIIDEFTGRMMPGRRYSEGQHQALEAKEGVTVQPENVTLASITFQNYFRLYKKLAGMTGTASTESEEFAEIYKLDVVEIPTNMPVRRIDSDDEVYRTSAEKLKAIVTEIEAANAIAQPLLVGTTSIEKSEQLADFLKSKGYKHDRFRRARRAGQALRGRALGQAVEAVRRAQRPLPRTGSLYRRRGRRARAPSPSPPTWPAAAPTSSSAAISTCASKQECAELEGEAREAREKAIRDEIADFKQKALAAGGLYIIGTERHESRRIDNQLRGRSGRQGDPGNSKFFLSLQDDLMRIFGSDRMDAMLVKLGLQEGEAIIHPWINKALEKAQQKVEARNFDMRKNVLKFDNVMNDQRKVVFEQRREMMAQESLEEIIGEMRHGVVDDLITSHIPHDAYPEAWDIAGLAEEVKTQLNIEPPLADWAKEEGIGDEEMRDRLEKAADEAYAAREKVNSPDLTRYIEKQVLLQTLDHLWREHLVVLDHLRQVIGWRGIAQRDPLNEYKSEAFDLFDALITRLRELVTGQLMRIEVARERPPEPQLPPMQAMHLDPSTGRGRTGACPDQRPHRGWRLHAAIARRRTSRRRSAIRTIRKAGAASAATSPVPADRARNTSIATACWPDAAVLARPRGDARDRTGWRHD